MPFSASSRVVDARLASIRFGNMLEPAARSESVVLPDSPTSFFSAKWNLSQNPTFQRCMMRQTAGAPPVAAGSQAKAYEKAVERLLIKVLLLVAAFEKGSEQDASSALLGILCRDVGLPIEFVKLVQKSYDEAIDKIAMQALLQLAEASDDDDEEAGESSSTNEEEPEASPTETSPTETSPTPSSEQSFSSGRSIYPRNSGSQQGNDENRPKVEEPLQQASTEDIESDNKTDSERLAALATDDSSAVSELPSNPLPNLAEMTTPVEGEGFQPEHIRVDIEISKLAIDHECAEQEDTISIDVEHLEHIGKISAQASEIMDSQAEDTTTPSVSSDDFSTTLHDGTNLSQPSDSFTNRSVTAERGFDVETTDNSVDYKTEIKRSTARLNAVLDDTRYLPPHLRPWAKKIASTTPKQLSLPELCSQDTTSEPTSPPIPTSQNDTITSSSFQRPAQTWKPAFAPAPSKIYEASEAVKASVPPHLRYGNEKRISPSPPLTLKGVSKSVVSNEGSQPGFKGLSRSMHASSERLPPKAKPIEEKPAMSAFTMKLMAKMGYKEGEGLGKEGEGILGPIEVNTRPKGAGLGVVREKTAQAKAEDRRYAQRCGEDYVDDDSDDESPYSSGGTDGATLMGWVRGKVE